MLIPKPTFFQRHALHIGLGSFILLTSFLYGITSGLSKSRASSPRTSAVLNLGPVKLERLSPPKGTVVVPLGRDMLINNHVAEMVSFTSERAATKLLDEQKQIWASQGLKVVSSAGQFRGYALGIKGMGEERYFFSAWTVPPALRQKVSAGMSTQGMMSVFTFSPADENSDGSVPGVPMKPGGKGGAIVSSEDPLGRTYSSAYTLPGTISENVDYYRSELQADGWVAVHAEASPFGSREQESGNLILHKGSEDLVMLFTPKDSESEGGVADIQTVVSITKGPLNIERWRNID